MSDGLVQPINDCRGFRNANVAASGCAGGTAKPRLIQARFCEFTIRSADEHPALCASERRRAASGFRGDAVETSRLGLEIGDEECRSFCTAVAEFLTDRRAVLARQPEPAG